MKVAIACAGQTSEWVSCRSITRNLREAYAHAFGESSLETFGYELSTDSFQAIALAKKIKDSNPDLIAIVDYKPHPYGLIKGLIEVYGEKAPPLNIHIFGDFVLNCCGWLDLEEDLKKLNVRFICASGKQQALLDNLIEHKNSTSIIPFPVDNKTFSYKDQDKSFLSPLGIAKEDIIITYTGRLSIQKNIFLLMTSFAELQQNFLPQARLILAGPMDDLGIPYLGKERAPGNFFYDYNHLLKEDIPETAAKRIHYLGNLGHEDLAKLYHASDLYSSFSAHNDEDFGMAPAEAASTGLPMLLSNWGGYASFPEALGEHCQLLPTSLQLKGENENITKIAPKKSHAIKALLKMALKLPSPEERKELAVKASSYLSIEASAKKIKNLEDGSFQGYTDLFRELCQTFKDRPKSPFKSYGGSYSHLYENVYGVYAK